MALPPPNEHVVRSWTNGSKAIVDLVKSDGGLEIRKTYRRGRAATQAMLREVLALHALRGLGIVPAIHAFAPGRRELRMSVLEGRRILEWVLEHYGPPGVDLDSFGSFHGLEQRVDIAEAFERFRRSDDAEAQGLKAAIRASYARLHRRRCVHGDPSPRNLLYDGRTVFLLDFDHWRPSFRPERIDGVGLSRWYGVSLSA